MFPPIYEDLLQPVRARIIRELKMSDGMAVPALVEALGMSYMGIKQHLQKLEKGGFVKTWRVPRQASGRPEKLYQLTAACDPLFPQGTTGLTLGLLQSADEVLGASAAEKILFRFFTNLRAEWTADVRKGKSMVEKATRLTALRDRLGIFSRCRFDAESGFRIEEYHHPLEAIFDRYPSAANMELRMMEELLGTKVTRSTRMTEKGARRTQLEVRTI